MDQLVAGFLAFVIGLWMWSLYAERRVGPALGFLGVWLTFMSALQLGFSFHVVTDRLAIVPAGWVPPL